MGGSIQSVRVQNQGTYRDKLRLLEKYQLRFCGIHNAPFNGVFIDHKIASLLFCFFANINFAEDRHQDTPASMRERFVDTATIAPKNFLSAYSFLRPGSGVSQADPGKPQKKYRKFCTAVPGILPGEEGCLGIDDVIPDPKVERE